MSIVSEFSGGNITFLANTFGNSSKSRETGGGFDFARHRVEPADEYWLDFWINPDKNWIEGTGGKLMGLGGGSATTGGAPQTPGGWSMRMMWGTYLGLRGYRYDQDRQSTYGNRDPFDSQRKFKVDEWTRVTEHIKLNTPNKFDGEVHFWVGGRLELAMESVRWRGEVDPAKAQIDLVMLQPFRGGGSPNWAVDQDTTLHFSDFYLCSRQPDFTQGSYDKPPVFADQAPPSLAEVLAESGVSVSWNKDAIVLKIPRRVA